MFAAHTLTPASFSIQGGWHHLRAEASTSPGAKRANAIGGQNRSVVLGHGPGETPGTPTGRNGRGLAAVERGAQSPAGRRGSRVVGGRAARLETARRVRPLDRARRPVRADRVLRPARPTVKGHRSGAHRAVISAGRGEVRSIIATSDVRAQARYYAAGTVARFPLFTMGGAPAESVPVHDLMADPIEGPQAIRAQREIERSVLGHRRFDAEVNWLLARRQGHLYRPSLTRPLSEAPTRLRKLTPVQDQRGCSRSEFKVS